MQVTIVAVDNIVLVDGMPRLVDCAALAAEGTQAVQWYDDHGHIEFVNAPDAEFRLNEAITDFTPYQQYVDAWEAAGDTASSLDPVAYSWGPTIFDMVGGIQYGGN